MTTEFTKNDEPPAAGDEGSSSESEPPETCADISVEDERWLAVADFQELIPRLVDVTLREVKLAPERHAVSIALLSDSEVRALNKAFRRKDTATNVLSFPSAPGLQSLKNTGAPVFLGDVALAYETIVKEASEQEKPVLHHAAHLVVHGVLHLAGLDHGTAGDAGHMEAAERLILGKFGIPDPYADDALSSSTSH